jgi:exo-1,4-beta-D-glucosaminidase
MLRILSVLLMPLTIRGSENAANLASNLVASAGDVAAIPGWYLRSALKVSDDLSALSSPEADSSSWYRVGARGTVMAGLIENGVYNETEMFYSDNMESVSDISFESPWIYRKVFKMGPSEGQYFTLKTDGITSKADIYLNGAHTATSDQQQGSYGGLQFNLTDHIREGDNCILIRAFPTNYLRDFAMGFVD